MSDKKLQYPREWGFRIIGENDLLLKQAAEATLVGKSIDISFSNISSGGKYISLEVTTFVSSEEERNAIYQALSEHPAIKRVI